MDRRQMVLTAVGPDRPGVVKKISSVIHEAGANLEDSRMAILSGDFALIVLFSGSAEAVEQIQREGRELEQDLGLQVRFKPTTPHAPAPDHAVFELFVTGVDQTGIVHRISEVLANLKVNVASLESRLSLAAFHGTPMFALQAKIQVPAENDQEKLRGQLDLVCEELNLNYDLNPIEHK